MTTGRSAARTSTGGCRSASTRAASSTRSCTCSTRFFTKVLYDLGSVGFTEPFPRLMNQGQVIYDGASMSKSKGNIVEPMPLVERWGADSMRLVMLFAGPFEDDIDWKVIEGTPEPPPRCARMARARVRGRRRRGGAG